MLEITELPPPRLTELPATYELLESERDELQSRELTDWEGNRLEFLDDISFSVDNGVDYETLKILSETELVAYLERGLNLRDAFEFIDDLHNTPPAVTALYRSQILQALRKLEQQSDGATDEHQVPDYSI